jgi:hypothetical protein
MARGFGSALGVGATDAISTRYTERGSALRSYSIWYNRNGSGGGGFGSLLRKAISGASGSEWIYYGTSSAPVTSIIYYRANTAASVTASSSLVPDATSSLLNVWNHLLITHDQSSGSLTAPVSFLNGQRALSYSITPQSLSASNNTDPFFIGNRADLSRNWDGWLAHMAIWDGVLLSSDDAVSLANGVSPLRVQSGNLVCYLPLDGVNVPEPDFLNFSSASIIGTRLANNGLMPVDTFGKSLSRQTLNAVGAVIPPPTSLTQPVVFIAT